MCAIAGIILLDREKRLQQEKCLKYLDKILSSMSHRGHDGTGFFVSKNEKVYFGHKRLSIIDPSSSGIQPRLDQTRTKAITFNGEIYNYLELREKLKKYFSFHSSTDTEVLLNQFVLEGLAGLNELRGMFSFAFFDEDTQQVTIARDQMGIKPLYWTKTKIEATEVLIFSSELRGILASELIKKTINMEALSFFVRFNSVYPPNTIIEGVNSLLPGHALEISNGEISEKCYWNVKNLKTDYSIDKTSPAKIKTIRETLCEAVQMNTRADTEVGAFLSGGLDSTAIVSLMRKELGKEVKTFSIGTKEIPELDESKVAEKTALELGCKHSTLEIDAMALKNQFNNFIDAIDQPSGDGINNFFVSQAASKEVKAALSGIGGDELFLGYRSFSDLSKMSSMKHWYPAKIFLPLLSKIHGRSRIARSIAFRSSMGFLKHWPLEKSDLYHSYRTLNSFDETKNFLAAFKLENYSTPYSWKKIESIFDTEKDLLNAFSKSEICGYLSGTLLRDADATSMYNTLEVRVPLLDIELIKMILEIPGNLKCPSNKKSNKPLLSSPISDLLPKHVTLLPKKGFELPMGYWMVRSLTQELRALSDCNWLSRSSTRKMIEDLYRCPKNYRKTWALLVMNSWISRNEIEIPIS